MIISDLNYLQPAEETDVLGGYNFGGNHSSNIYENLYINKYLKSKVDVYGNFAGAEADAVAEGYNTSTQAISSTYTKQGVASASNATSVSASAGSYFHHHH
ncbi:MAG: hypothetical protein KME13_19020 [Myxacorys californica WJT36-NPBG1]|jgi:hypothetical protein|nr:hypothetical protein [Myxacorys californica WJT36-NPBG1]